MACTGCGEVLWLSGPDLLDPDVGMARLFGEFDLLGSIEAVAAPSRRVLVYEPPSRRARGRLAAFPAHHWLQVSPALWLATDGERLLLAPTDPLLAENLSNRR